MSERPPPPISEVRPLALEADRRIASAAWYSVQDLAARWGVDPDTVRGIPRDHLPYLALGAKRPRRRYDPADVAEYERRAKRGEFV